MRRNDSSLLAGPGPGAGAGLRRSDSSLLPGDVGLRRNESTLSVRHAEEEARGKMHKMKLETLYLASIDATVTSRSLLTTDALGGGARPDAEPDEPDEPAEPEEEPYDPASGPPRRDQLPAFFRAAVDAADAAASAAAADAADREEEERRERRRSSIADNARRRSGVADPRLHKGSDAPPLHHPPNPAEESEQQFLLDTVRAFLVPASQRTEADQDQLVAFTKHVHILHSLKLSDIARAGLCRASVLHRYEPGEFVIREGDACTMVCIMVMGTAHVKKRGLGLLATVTTFDVVGELALLRNVRTRSASIVAETACAVLHISASDYDYYLRQWHRKTVKSRMDFLHSVPQLRNFTAHNLLMASQMLRTKHFEVGEFLLLQGEVFQFLYIISEGSANVLREITVRVRRGGNGLAPRPPPAAEGGGSTASPRRSRQLESGPRFRKKTEIIGRCCPRDVLGEESLQTDAPQPQEVSVVCTEDVTVLWLTRAEFGFLKGAGYDVNAFIAHA